ncbi:MAG: hypothetical protein CMJ25_06485 [Phycisphaerae bacterium]|nr:hypothetical protein [Phycisphaerae bacterium]|tara:strand:- start:1380 stop:1880 length:501 start_codon:yes stop_codon:yes gene_type:complete
MKIDVPAWTKDIKDEGVLLFIAFADRLADMNGYDVRYTMEISDVTRICNKRSHGMEDWFRSYDVIYDNMIIGRPFASVLSFEFKKSHLTGTKGSTYKMKRPPRIKYNIKKSRAKLVWMYLLGCLNNNLIGTDTNPDVQLGNTFGYSTFKITREAGDYMGAYESKNA